jgi:hypothetical protein
MLEAPRLLLALAELPLVPPEPPPNVPLLRELAVGEAETLRFPILSPPPAPLRFIVLAWAPPRFAPVLPAPARLVVPAWAPPRVPWAEVCRADGEVPRAVPPYLFAVALFAYGAPPRCCELCCQLLLPLPLLLTLLMFCLLELFT